MRQPGLHHNIPVIVNPMLEVGSPPRALFIAFMMEQVCYLPLHSFYAPLIPFETKTRPVLKVQSVLLHDHFLLNNVLITSLCVRETQTRDLTEIQDTTCFI
jgi:hypothetical protein